MNRNINRNSNTKPAEMKHTASRHQRSKHSQTTAVTYIPSSVCCPPVLDPFGRDLKPDQQLASRRRCDDSLLQLRPSLFDSPEFQWLERQRNNNSGESSSRKLASKETCRRDVENWLYLHFRFRMDSYRSLVYAVKQASKDENLFNEEHLDKWTLKMKFRIRNSSPLKTALMACASRLGLENDPDVIFCTDGFYGDVLTGRINNKNEVANRVVQATSTCLAMGLINGSCLFVSRATQAERENASVQVQIDFLRSAEVSSAGNVRRDIDFEEDETTMSELHQEHKKRSSINLSSVGKNLSNREVLVEGS